MILADGLTRHGFMWELFIPSIIFIIYENMNDLALKILEESLRSTLIGVVNSFTSLLYVQVFLFMCLSDKILLHLKILLQGKWYKFDL